MNWTSWRRSFQKIYTPLFCPKKGKAKILSQRFFALDRLIVSQTRFHFWQSPISFLLSGFLEPLAQRIIFFSKSFCGLSVKTIDISKVFGYTILNESGGEQHDYPTTIFKHAENLP